MEMRARFRFPLMVHISRWRSQNVAPPIRRRWTGKLSPQNAQTSKTHLIFELISHLGPVNGFSCSHCSFTHLFQLHLNIWMIRREAWCGQPYEHSNLTWQTYLVTVDSTSVAFSQLSCLANHLGDSLQNKRPKNRQSAGSACMASGTCQSVLVFSKGLKFLSVP
jgi:hypothetical protein